MPINNRQIIYANTPSPAIDPSLTNGTFKLNASTIPNNVPTDKILVRAHYLSLDPAMRQWLTAKRSYIAPVERGHVMRGQSIAQVVAVGDSLKTQYKAGDWVIAYSGWQEYATLLPKEAQKVVVPPGCQPTDAMSVLGMTGLTAYFGMMEIGQPRKGDTVVVSGAAGATGMVAGQIAKIQGAKRVVGLAGSADKCEFLRRELGFDAAINYKDADWKKQLKEATPEYIDVFFDNVGGEILDVCLSRAARDSRFVICGAISQYNAKKPTGPASFMNVISQRVTMKGFIVFDFAKKYPAALQNLGTWLAQGKLKRKDHIIKGGLEAAPQGLVNLYEGANTGKMMVEVTPLSEALGGKAKL
ncbi:NAD(P)-binding protein [Aspergillus campestris IBT 28561]|uniref:NAD(P)-binding protein n=1 Tax=Aspergillus campestris (strain IBT 28561) TaxID=1392248 RepID=A0A2I1CUF0_ASPC2|nr:NAD(P)-binding protein [Aspergillus campestris IBT 28561]PKY01237.1 NAD(P)-binding protein [Aspergillus campestris IBT 28561]